MKRYLPLPKPLFTTRMDAVDGLGKPVRAIKSTSDLVLVKKWHDEKRLILFGAFRMDNGKTTKLITTHNSIEDILRLWDRGYSIEKAKQKEEAKVQDKLRNILTEVADALEPTNAQKAHYFRNASPYQEGRLLVVDFPTACNLVKSTSEEFKKAGKPYQIKTLYHGTRVSAIPSIMRRGLKRSRSGMLGAGIYVGPLSKAENYTDLLVLEVKVVLGNCKELTKVETLHDNGEFDSLHAPSGPLEGVYKKFLNHEEWVIRFPKQVEVTRLIIPHGPFA